MPSRTHVSLSNGLEKVNLPLVIVAGVSFAAVFVLYRLFFAPLSRLPGPRLTALTKLWIMYHEFKGGRTALIDELHQRYGPIVRISPDEVSFNNHEALKEIYGIKSDFSKSDFYDMFIYYNERNTFTSLSKTEVPQYLHFRWSAGLISV
jgi:hypothetical protein